MRLFCLSNLNKVLCSRAEVVEPDKQEVLASLLPREVVPRLQGLPVPRLVLREAEDDPSSRLVLQEAEGADVTRPVLQ